MQKGAKAGGQLLMVSKKLQLLLLPIIIPVFLSIYIFLLFSFWAFSRTENQKKNRMQEFSENTTIQ